MAGTPEQDFDGILRLIAGDIVNESHIESLGKSLGFRIGLITNYIKSNHRFGDVTCEGTLKMLRDWSITVARDQQAEMLRDALVKAKLQGVADEHFPLDGNRAVVTVLQKPPPRDPTVYVTENQIMHIARNLLSDFYAPLANYLGFQYAEYENIKKKHLLDIKAATLEILHIWKEQTGGEHKVLEEALQKAECARLAYTYKEVI